MTKAYFAHSMLDYDSDLEAQKRLFIEHTFKVLCPNRDLGELGGIEPYIKAMAKCDVVVVWEHNNYVGRGVFAEVLQALHMGKLVFALRGLVYYNVEHVIIHDSNDWKNKYGRLIVSRME